MCDSSSTGLGESRISALSKYDDETSSNLLISRACGIVAPRVWGLIGGRGLSTRGEGRGDIDRSEKAVEGESVLVLGDGVVFHPKKLPNLPAGDFGRSISRASATPKDSFESVLFTPSNCSVMLGAPNLAFAAVWLGRRGSRLAGVTVWGNSVACGVESSEAYRVWMWMPEERLGLCAEEAVSLLMRELMETVRSWPEPGIGKT